MLMLLMFMVPFSIAKSLGILLILLGSMNDSFEDVS